LLVATVLSLRDLGRDPCSDRPDLAPGLVASGRAAASDQAASARVPSRGSGSAAAGAGPEPAPGPARPRADAAVAAAAAEPAAPEAVRGATGPGSGRDSRPVPDRDRAHAARTGVAAAGPVAADSAAPVPAVAAGPGADPVRAGTVAAGAFPPVAVADACPLAAGGASRRPDSDAAHSRAGSFRDSDGHLDPADARLRADACSGHSNRSGRVVPARAALR